MSTSVFWEVTTSVFVGRYEHFGGTYCLHLQANAEDGGSTLQAKYTVTDC
jgi:hypothetical protein